MTPERLEEIRETVAQWIDAPLGTFEWYSIVVDLLAEITRLRAELAGARAAQPDVCEWRPLPAYDDGKVEWRTACGRSHIRLAGNRNGGICFCGKPIRVIADAGERRGE